jgi:hypothetical protein
MTDFILATENLPFTIALALMVGIGLLEGVTTLLGFGASSFIESFLPDMDVDVDIDVDIDADIDAPDLAEMGSPGALSGLLSWFNIGRVPILILLVLFLLGFGMMGLIVQSAAQKMTGFLLPGLSASAFAFAGAMIFVKFSGMAMAKVIPKDETEAVSESSFIGRVAVIVTGTAKRRQPAQAKLRDTFGQSHYIMVEPDRDEDVFQTGSEVLLVRQSSAVFYAIPAEGVMRDA